VVVAVADQTQRPVVPTQLADEKEHRRLIATRANASFPKDGTEGMTAPVKLAAYTVSTLPSASEWGAGATIYVSDETGGSVEASSDGTNWRRSTDRAVVS